MRGAAEKAKRTVLAIAIPRDELALRIGVACTGVRPPDGTPAGAALDQLDAMSIPGGIPMGASFRKAADAAVLYFHECTNAGKAPN